MKTDSAFAATLAACALSSAPAMADFSPAPSSGTMVGTLAISQVDTQFCDFHADYEIDASGSTMTLSNIVFSPGAPLCSSITVFPLNTEWTLADAGGGSVDVTIANFFTSFGTCEGTVNVTWTNGAGGPLFLNTAVPGMVFGQSVSCLFSGQLATMPSVTLN